ncbi:MAG: hypothetical protein AVDCRST_MAG65-2011 [uncultured Solirubrobacteraceae bacterium]|uniref:Uncharacterized protein n=1 Tax=uncultured Solirubrobacteraceae bacterium TaxID=1162706 RepID=A0A6J4SDL9_9ACTN|nr:MAG: hypothetical protein AVDCRST_MAG65-2011 [uncultured Solirubrobacteraceae bacterium]
MRRRDGDRIIASRACRQPARLTEAVRPGRRDEGRRSCSSPGARVSPRSFAGSYPSAVICGTGRTA